MGELLMILALLLFLIGFPATIVTTIVFAVKKKKIKAPAICIPVSLVLSLIFLAIGAELYSRTDEYKENNEKLRIEEGQEKTEKESEKQKEEASTTETPTQEPTTINIDELPEDEYKVNCKQIYYEDIKDKSGVSKDDYVKIEAYLQQTFQRDIYESMVDDLWEEHHLDLTYFEFGVLSKQHENNYGGENMLLFSNDYDLSPYSYKNADKIIAYGKVIDVKTNGWTGRSNIYFIPKYIEKIN